MKETLIKLIEQLNFTEPKERTLINHLFSKGAIL
jgi:hypothetical protein